MTEGQEKVLKLLNRGQHRFHFQLARSVVQKKWAVRDETKRGNTWYISLTDLGIQQIKKHGLDVRKNNKFVTDDLPVIKDILADELFPQTNGELLLVEPFARLYYAPVDLPKRLAEVGIPNRRVRIWTGRNLEGWFTWLKNKQTGEVVKLPGSYGVTYWTIYHAATVNKLFEIMDWDKKYIYPADITYLAETYDLEDRRFESYLEGLNNAGFH